MKTSTFFKTRLGFTFTRILVCLTAVIYILSLICLMVIWDHFKLYSDKYPPIQFMIAILTMMAICFYLVVHDHITVSRNNLKKRKIEEKLATNNPIDIVNKCEFENMFNVIKIQIKNKKKSKLLSFLIQNTPNKILGNSDLTAFCIVHSMYHELKQIATYESLNYALTYHYTDVLGTHKQKSLVKTLCLEELEQIMLLDIMLSDYVKAIILKRGYLDLLIKYEDFHPFHVIRYKQCASTYLKLIVQYNFTNDYERLKTMYNISIIDIVEKDVSILLCLQQNERNDSRCNCSSCEHK